MSLLNLLSLSSTMLLFLSLLQPSAHFAFMGAKQLLCSPAQESFIEVHFFILEPPSPTPYPAPLSQSTLLPLILFWYSFIHLFIYSLFV